MNIETMLTQLYSQTILSVKIAWPLMSIVLPIFLIYLLWKMRVYYVRRVFDSKQKYVLLDIRVPKEISKSPAAMELFLNVLHQVGGEANPYHYLWLGKSRAISSLEIVSIGGAIHFYIRVRGSIKNQVEAALYAQYPGVEVYPAEDYTKDVFYHKSDIELFGSEFVVARADAYPIKTYIDYGLDRDPKEEFKIDPLTHLVEFLGIMTSGEQFWLQYVVRAYKGKMASSKTVEIEGKKITFPTQHWEKGAKTLVDEILNRDPKTRMMKKPEKDGDKFVMPQISKSEHEIVESIQRAQNKFAFEVGIRVIYLAKKEKFNGTNIGGLMSIVKQFGATNYNSFRPSNVTSNDDYPWTDWDFITRKQKRKILAAYKKRQFYFTPYERPTSVMNSEAVATLFHLPGQVLATPTFARIESRKSEPPANLPI